MKHFILALLAAFLLAFVHEGKAGGTGNPYIYTYAGDPSTAAVASLDPPKGALVYDTTNNVWRLKTSARGSNAGYDILITGTAASTLVNAVLTTPAITGGSITSSTLTTPTITGGLITSATSVTPTISIPAITGGLLTSSTFSKPLISATTGTTAGTLGTSGTNLFFYNGTAWVKLDN